jgi:hypothetical protein
MDSTKLTGLAIFFLINLFGFHALFKGLTDHSQASTWLICALLGAITTYILQITAMSHKESS